MIQGADGGYLLALNSDSGPDGIKSLPGHGHADTWLVKLAPDVPMLRSRVA